MRRIVQPYRFIFVDRARGWSFLFFVSSVALLAMGAMAAERSVDPTARPLSLLSYLGSGVLFLVALWFLFRKRAFIVDIHDKSLTILEGRLLGKKSARYPLDQVSIKMERKVLRNASARSGPHVLIVGRIFLRVPGSPDILFLDDLRGPEAETLATQLATDLDRPLTTVEREDW